MQIDEKTDEKGRNQRSRVHTKVELRGRYNIGFRKTQNGEKLSRLP
jgi:hypothetical protein